MHLKTHFAVLYLRVVSSISAHLIGRRLLGVCMCIVASYKFLFRIKDQWKIYTSTAVSTSRSTCQLVAAGSWTKSKKNYLVRVLVVLLHVRFS